MRPFGVRAQGATWSDLDLARARLLARAGRWRLDGYAALPPKVRAEIWSPARCEP